MDSIEDRILNRMKVHYNSLEKALAWYNKPNRFFEHKGKDASPKVMVDAGKGEQVLDWIKLTIG